MWPQEAYSQMVQGREETGKLVNKHSVEWKFLWGKLKLKGRKGKWYFICSSYERPSM